MLASGVRTRTSCAVAPMVAAHFLLKPPNVWDVVAIEGVLPPPDMVDAIGTTVAIKLPDLWMQNLRITASRTKYDIVLATLPMAMLDSVQDMVQRVGGDTAKLYELLKARLLGSCGLTDWQMIAECSKQLTNVMVALLPGKLFLYHFLMRLPDNIRSAIEACKFKTPRDFAAFADSLWGACGRPALPLLLLLCRRLHCPPSTTSPACGQETALPAATISGPTARHRQQPRVCCGFWSGTFLPYQSGAPPTGLTLQGADSKPIPLWSIVHTTIRVV